MYGYDNDETGELPRVEPHRPWIFDPHPADRPHQSPPPPDETTATFAVPSSHRSRSRYAGGYPQAYPEPDQLPRENTVWWRSRSALAVGLSVLVLLVLGTAGFALLRGDDDPAPVGIDRRTTSTAAESATPSASPTSPAASPTPPPTPRITRTQAVVPIPTVKPPPAELPPPPPPPVPDTPSCIQHHPEQDAPPDQVRTALATAGGRQYWPGVEPRPLGLEGSYPVITVPAAMMNAVAWAESSWRSTVIACDKGIGLMQVMPDTAPWMNDRFGRNYDPATVEGNAAIGAMYLEWLTMYFGLYYFGSFDLDVVEAVGDGGARVRLRDVVIAAYNVGYGEVENTHGTAEAADDTISIPNQWYVDRVNGYIANCPCDAM